MEEHNDSRTTEIDGWPVPSRDVLRDLDRRALAWPEPDGETELAAAA